jgi:hypothetical protein
MVTDTYALVLGTVMVFMTGVTASIDVTNSEYVNVL